MPEMPLFDIGLRIKVGDIINTVIYLFNNISRFSRCSELFESDKIYGGHFGKYAVEAKQIPESAAPGR